MRDTLHMPTRRSFLLASAAAPLASDGPWHQRVRRVGQVNFNEHDPVEADVEAWGDYWASAKVDAVLVNVTGMLAFYPTQVPFHKRCRKLTSKELCCITFVPLAALPVSACWECPRLSGSVSQLIMDGCSCHRKAKVGRSHFIVDWH